MCGLVGALRFLVGKARLVDQQVCLMGGDGSQLARRGVAGDHDLAASARLADHLFRRDSADRLAFLEAREVRPRLHAESLRLLGIEAAEAVVLDERVAEGAHTVLDLERADLVSVVANRRRARRAR